MATRKQKNGSATWLIIALAIILVTPRSLVHALLEHDHCASFGVELTVAAKGTAGDCNFQEYDKPDHAAPSITSTQFKPRPVGVRFIPYRTIHPVIGPIGIGNLRAPPVTC